MDTDSKTRDQPSSNPCESVPSVANPFLKRHGTVDSREWPRVSGCRAALTHIPFTPPIQAKEKKMFRQDEAVERGLFFHLCDTKVRSIQSEKDFHHQGTKFRFVSCIAAGDTEKNCRNGGSGFSWCLGGVPDL
ncbi:MAG: hypothetical protein HY014_01960 [Acidobacteria bacterium]|nr:hypothetical protein [Acidobacteriota bacterium]MBI3486914.1 hypothetical protein [Acidobacteriota bacterium]